MFFTESVLNRDEPCCHPSRAGSPLLVGHSAGFNAWASARHNSPAASPTQQVITNLARIVRDGTLHSSGNNLIHDLASAIDVLHLLIKTMAHRWTGLLA